jgi:hypothetical protein
MYVGSEAHGGGAVYKSYDRGDQWSAANEGIESVAVFALAMDPNEPSVLYVTGPEGTYKTTSGGESRRDGTRATGSPSDDSLSVRYNLITLLSDFDFLHSTHFAPVDALERGDVGHQSVVGGYTGNGAK